MKNRSANNKKGLNEATIQARIDGVLKQVFPTFREVKIIHQKSFTLKLGHHDVLVDHAKPSQYGTGAISDILLKVDDKNVILLELKKEGLKLTDRDLDQGISYARLIHPMPPITLISNGKVNVFYNTYTKEALNESSINVEFLQTITDNAFKLATSDTQDALNTILNRDTDLFSEVINSITEEKFNRLTGNIRDYEKPLCHSFSIERSILKDITNLFEKSISLVGIVASAYSGKTNLLHQFFKQKKEYNFLFYIDCKDLNSSVFQQLANEFTKKTRISISTDKIREWLINALNSTTKGKFYLLIDNFNKEISSKIKDEIIECIELINGINHHILYTIDENNFDKLARVPHKKHRTIIGQRSKIIRLEELNSAEFENARKQLFFNHNIDIQYGGHHTSEYRQPRILRYLASYFSRRTDGKCYYKINAVPDLDHLRLFGENDIFSDSVHKLYKKLVHTFFEDSDKRKKSPDLSIMASGTGAVTKKTFNKKYSKYYEDLITSSVTVARKLPGGKDVIYPKVPELIAYHAIKPILKKIKKLDDTNVSITEIVKALENQCSQLPYSDIVATGVLWEIGNGENFTFFSRLVKELMKHPPRRDLITKGTRALMYSEDTGHIELNFTGDNPEENFIANMFPFIILSQLAAFLLGHIKEDGTYSYNFHLSLIDNVASNENILRLPTVRPFKYSLPIEQYSWKGIGDFVSGREGIVEPIVQSIYKCFFQIPLEIKRIYDRAFEIDNFPLLWRIHLAIREIADYQDESLSNQVKDFNNRFQVYSRGYITNFLLKNNDDPQLRSLVEEIIKINTKL